MEQRILPPKDENSPKLSERMQTVIVFCFVLFCGLGVALVALLTH